MRGVLAKGKVIKSSFGKEKAAGILLRAERSGKVTLRSLHTKKVERRRPAAGCSTCALSGARLYFHSQTLLWVFPPASALNSNTAATEFKRASAGDAEL
jgi:hypothetical protein